MDIKTVAIIPARGSSKRLPRKNILPLDGKPLLGHTIEQALQSSVFSDVIVSTEDSEISRIAQQFGARIHERDPKLASDEARVRDVCLAVLQECFEDFLSSVEGFCVLTATSALRTVEDIKESYRIFIQGLDWR
jgi:CMP-N-acetylneuraminic acid synthetase